MKKVEKLVEPQDTPKVWIDSMKSGSMDIALEKAKEKGLTIIVGLEAYSDIAYQKK